jgi:hypothetical protein
MGRDRPARNRGGLRRGPPLEQQQDAASADIEGAHPAVGPERVQAKRFIKFLSAGEVVYIESGFEDGV